MTWVQEDPRGPGLHRWIPSPVPTHSSQVPPKKMTETAASGGRSGDSRRGSLGVPERGPGAVRWGSVPVRGVLGVSIDNALIYMQAKT